MPRENRECSDGKDCPPPIQSDQILVTKAFCDERFQRVVDKLDTINQNVTELRQDKKESDHAYRNVILSIISGAVIATIAWVLTKMPH